MTFCPSLLTVLDQSRAKFHNGWRITARMRALSSRACGTRAGPIIYDRDLSVPIALATAENLNGCLVGIIECTCMWHRDNEKATRWSVKEGTVYRMYDRRHAAPDCPDNRSVSTLAAKHAHVQQRVCSINFHFPHFSLKSSRASSLAVGGLRVSVNKNNKKSTIESLTKPLFSKLDFPVFIIRRNPP